MKLHLCLLLFVAVGAYAFPSAGDGVLVQYKPILKSAAEDRVRAVIERFINTLRNSGWDPLNVARREFDIPYSNSQDFAAKAFIENLHVSGLSDIRTNHLEYDYMLNIMRFDFYIPEIKLSLGNSDIKAVIHGREFDGQLRGSMSINNIRIQGSADIDINIHGHIRVRDISLDTGLGSIEANFSAVGQGVDRSEDFKNLVEVRFPTYLKDNKDYIDRSLEDIALFILFFVCCI